MGADMTPPEKVEQAFEWAKRQENRFREWPDRIRVDGPIECNLTKTVELRLWWELPGRFYRKAHTYRRPSYTVKHLEGQPVAVRAVARIHGVFGYEHTMEFLKIVARDNLRAAKARAASFIFEYLWEHRE